MTGTEQKKYEFTGKTRTVGGVTLRQIRALVRLPGVVAAGDVGGWIETEENLSHGGDAWVEEDAAVYGNACVSGHAYVCDMARVYEHADVYGNARVSGEARVYGNARVYGAARVYGVARLHESAQVYGNAYVYGDAHLYGNAQVCGNARVHERARVHGDAKVYGNTHVYGTARVNGTANVCGDVSVHPVVITGLDQHVTITDRQMCIGASNHDIDAWESFTDLQVDAMDDGMLGFWKAHRKVLLELFRVTGRPVGIMDDEAEAVQ